jgi:VanZ family protein
MFQNRILPVVLFCCLGAICFFALKPSPELRGAVIPVKVSRFFGEHDFLNNFMAFFVTSAAALFALKGNFRNCVLLLLVFLVPGLEWMQMFLPQRHPDLSDVLAGWLGITTVAVLSFGWGWIRKKPAADKEPAPSSARSCL